MKGAVWPGRPGFWSLIVRDYTMLWFVNAFLPVFIVIATALFLLLCSAATLGTEPKKAPYAITGVSLGEAHKVNVEWIRFTVFV